MPEPVPAPTAEELVILADIVMEDTDSVTAAVAANSSQDISDAQWELTLEDIETWRAVFPVGRQQKKKIGPLEWYQGSEMAELDFRNRLRHRYGYSSLTSIRGEALNPSSLAWF